MFPCFPVCFVRRRYKPYLKIVRPNAATAVTWTLNNLYISFPLKIWEEWKHVRTVGVGHTSFYESFVGFRKWIFEAEIDQHRSKHRCLIRKALYGKNHGFPLDELFLKVGRMPKSIQAQRTIN